MNVNMKENVATGKNIKDLLTFSLTQMFIQD